MIEERGTKLDIEVEEEPTKESQVFYNPKMILNRDISVSALKVYSEDQKVDLKVLDALGGTGVRGIRYLREVPGIEKVVINDSKPDAFENIKKNLELNSLKTKVEVTSRDANLLMSERRKGFHYIDLDPFGSPARFIDSTARSLKHDSFIGITATDLAALCGTYRKTCRRKYGSWVQNLSYHHEVGIRVLIKSVFDALAVHNKVFDPKLCYAEKHYYRIMGEVRETKKGVNRSLKNIGFLSFCSKCGYRKFSGEKDYEERICPKCEQDTGKIGPLWTGKIGRKDFIHRVKDDLDEKGFNEASELADMLEKEVDIKKPFYDTHNIGKITGQPAVRRDKLIENIRDKGYNAEKTHFCPTGIKTSAPIEDILSISKEMNRKK